MILIALSGLAGILECGALSPLLIGSGSPLVLATHLFHQAIKQFQNPASNRPLVLKFPKTQHTEPGSMFRKLTLCRIRPLHMLDENC